METSRLVLVLLVDIRCTMLLVIHTAEDNNLLSAVRAATTRETSMATAESESLTMLKIGELKLELELELRRSGRRGGG